MRGGERSGIKKSRRNVGRTTIIGQGDVKHLDKKQENRDEEILMDEINRNKLRYKMRKKRG